MAGRAATSPLDSLLAPIEASLSFVGETAMLAGDTLRRLVHRPFEWKETINQMAFIGVSSVPLVAMTNFFSGAVLALYSVEFLVKYGGSSFAGATVGLAMCREIAPVLAGLMVAARCGSAMAALIAQMQVTEQVDALKMLSVNPTSYLVVPRVVAAVTMLPVLTLVGMYSGVLGGWMVASASGVAGGAFFDSLRSFLRPWDFLGGMLKTPFFGLIVALIAAQQGFRTKEGAVGVGRATTNTVVLSMVFIYIVNYFLATWYFGLKS
ncbi:MAG TPA: ABC transporter permease [Fimbriimonadaceae bacterium]|nr:ABC transporter permease [Fimbriimonadaceae bacterium]